MIRISDCQTVFPEKMTQKVAAVEAVRRVKLNQLREVDEKIFDCAPEWKEMFYRRLAILNEASGRA